MTKLVVTIDTDAGTATMTQADPAPAAGVPPLLPNTFEGRPPVANGVVTADWWMVGKPGAQKGALDAHWTQYNMITAMMGGATEFDIVCAPKPDDPVQLDPSHYNSTVRHAWELGWCTQPPGMGQEPTDEIRKQWADYYTRFKQEHMR